MRIDKYLCDLSIGTRKEVKNYIKKGLVTINNITIKDSDHKVDEGKDQVHFNNELLVYEKYVYLMLNKPAGVVSATFDNKDTTVIDLIDELKLFLLCL